MQSRLRCALCPIHHDEQLLDLKNPHILSFLSEDDIERHKRCEKRWLRYKPDVEAELTPEERKAVTPWYLRA